MERGDDGLAAIAHEVQHAKAPLAGIEPEFMLQAHHVTRAVVGHFRGQAVCIGALVVDDVNHPVVVSQGAGLLNRRHGGNRLGRDQINRVGGVSGKRRQPTLFGRIGRNKKGPNGMHRSPPMVAANAKHVSSPDHKFRTQTISFHAALLVRAWAVVRRRSQYPPSTTPTPAAIKTDLSGRCWM